MPIVANIDFGGRPQDVVSPKSIARTKEILGDAAEVVGFNHMCALAAPPRRCLLRLLSRPAPRLMASAARAAAEPPAAAQDGLALVELLPREH